MINYLLWYHTHANTGNLEGIGIIECIAYADGVGGSAYGNSNYEIGMGYGHGNGGYGYVAALWFGSGEGTETKGES